MKTRQVLWFIVVISAMVAAVSYGTAATAPVARSGRLIQFAEHPISSTSDTGDVVSVHSCDLDGDSDVDIVAAATGAWSTNPNNITWFENDGNSPPGFTEHYVTVGYGNGYMDVQAIDMNQDGSLDLLVAAG